MIGLAVGIIAALLIIALVVVLIIVMKKKKQTTIVQAGYQNQNKKLKNSQVTLNPVQNTFNQPFGLQ